jgi:hypothetical protein
MKFSNLLTAGITIAILATLSYGDDATPPVVDLPQSPTAVEAKTQYDLLANKTKVDYLAKLSVAIRAYLQKLDQAQKTAERSKDDTEVQRIIQWKQVLAEDPAMAAQAVENAQAAIDARAVVLKVVLTEAFLEDGSQQFPAINNRARGGLVKVSGTQKEYKNDPLATLGGVRWGDIWCIDSETGWYLAGWDKAVVGRYILVFCRNTDSEHDPWGDARIQINKSNPIPIKGMSGKHTLIVDLGKSIEIKSIRIDFHGNERPGLCGLEIHPDQH